MTSKPHLKTDVGHIYILSNPAFKYLKIGATRTELDKRVRSLSESTSIPFPFKVEASRICKDLWAAESSLHSELREYRVKKEFFDVDIDTAKKALDGVYVYYSGDTFKALLDKEEDKKMKALAEVDIGEVDLG